MASKAQMQMLLNMGKSNPQQSNLQQPNPQQSTGQTPPFHKKKKGNLSGAARRKLASLQQMKKQGQKNGTN